MVVPVMRAIVVGAAAMATCFVTRNSAQTLPLEKIVRVGQDTYKIRVEGRIDVADSIAKNRASEYCARMKRIVVVKYEAFDMGEGYRLTWSCLPPGNSGQHLPLGRIVRGDHDSYRLRVKGALDAAEKVAAKKSYEYCARINKNVVVTYQAFDPEYGFRITWSCLPSQHGPINPPPY